MVIIKLMGGLGNQMFQYATGYRLAKYRHTQLKLDISSYENMAKIDTPRHYELDKFNIKGALVSAKDLASIRSDETLPPITQKAWHKLGLGSLVFNYSETSPGFQPAVLKLSNNTRLIGWWQSEKYFTDIRSDLVEQFTPASPLSKKSQSILKNIESIKNSVSIHVRRGDYISNRYANAHHGIATTDYYKQAIKYINQAVRNPKFFVFSDEIDWSKKHLGLAGSAIFVEGNLGDKAFEDLWLMSKCKHNIIANSSFSWWGAWLNEASDKLVIAPDKWYQDSLANAETNIVPTSWIRL